MRRVDVRYQRPLRENGSVAKAAIELLGGPRVLGMRIVV
jgi:hypothetical protein